MEPCVNAGMFAEDLLNATVILVRKTVFDQVSKGSDREIVRSFHDHDHNPERKERVEYGNAGSLIRMSRVSIRPEISSNFLCPNECPASGGYADLRAEKNAMIAAIRSMDE